MAKSRRSVAQRIIARDSGYAQRCAILGCGQQTMRSAGLGLAVFHCRRHVEHKAWHGTYSAAAPPLLVIADAGSGKTKHPRPLACASDRQWCRTLAASEMTNAGRAHRAQCDGRQYAVPSPYADPKKQRVASSISQTLLSQFKGGFTSRNKRAVSVPRWRQPRRIRPRYKARH